MKGAVRHSFVPQTPADTHLFESLPDTMFELFSRMAKRPTLTKLDDDGETQMDMCKSAALPCIPWSGAVDHFLYHGPFFVSCAMGVRGAR